jgi:hypothetical protein
MRITAKRLTVTLCLTLFVLGGTGCFVLDELQKANESAGVVDPSKAKEAEKAELKLSQAEQAKKDKIKDYWKEIQSLAPEELDESIVRCNNKGAVSFMGNDECLSIGGTIE